MRLEDRPCGRGLRVSQFDDFNQNLEAGSRGSTSLSTLLRRLMPSLLAAVGLAMVAAAASFYRGAATAVDPDLVGETRTVTRGELLVSVNQKGTLESSRNVEIKCEIRGGYGGRGGHSMVTWVIPAGSLVKKGDELVRLDTQVIEETVSLGKTDTGIATAALARAQVDHSVAKTAVDGYLSGSYQQQMQSLLQRKELSERYLATSKVTLSVAKSEFRKGWVTRLAVEANEYTVEQAKLDLNVVQTEIDVLERLTKKMRLETFNGQVTATQARLKGREAGVDLEQSKLDLAEVHSNLGATLQDLGKPEEAWASYRKALALEPDIGLSSHKGCWHGIRQRCRPAGSRRQRCSVLPRCRRWSHRLPRWQSHRPACA